MRWKSGEVVKSVQKEKNEQKKTRVPEKQIKKYSHHFHSPQNPVVEN